jgi:hypothetical protein
MSPSLSGAQVNAGEAAYPTAVIANGQIRATIYLPDTERGFYRSTRFDWSGMIASLECRGHQYYGPWFTTAEAGIRDFIYRDADIVAGPESAAVGPAEEFPMPQGFTSAPAGGRFVKIGVGVLRKPDDGPYSAFARYDLLDAGRWSVEAAADAVSFTQTLDDPVSGYGYVYRKGLRLVSGQPELVISHRLRNTGRRPLETTQYNHNFLTFGGAVTGPAVRIVVPFAILTPAPPDPALAAIDGNVIRYEKTLIERDRVSFPIDGFGPEASDYDVRIENTASGAGVQMRSDRPMVRALLWSIRSVISFEPFVDVTTPPGATTEWELRYTYYTLP